MTTFEKAWKRLVAALATVVSVTLISLGLLAIVLQVMGTSEPPSEPQTLRWWDDEENGIRCYTWGENLRCFAVTDVSEEDDDDSFPEDEWFKRISTEGL